MVTASTIFYNKYLISATLQPMANISTLLLSLLISLLEESYWIVFSTIIILASILDVLASS